MSCFLSCLFFFFTISVSTLSLDLFCLSFSQPVSMFLFCASFYVWFYSFSPYKTEQYVHSNRNGRDLNTLLHHISGAATVAYLLHNLPHIFASNFAEVKARCLNGVCMKKNLMFLPSEHIQISVTQSSLIAAFEVIVVAFV